MKLWDCKVPWPPTHLVVQATLRLSKRDRSTAFTWSSIIYYVPIPRNMFNNTNDKYAYIYIYISNYIYTSWTWSTNVWGDYNWLILGMLTPVPKRKFPSWSFSTGSFSKDSKFIRMSSYTFPILLKNKLVLVHATCQCWYNMFDRFHQSQFWDIGIT